MGVSNLSADCALLCISDISPFVSTPSELHHAWLDTYIERTRNGYVPMEQNHSFESELTKGYLTLQDGTCFLGGGLLEVAKTCSQNI